MKVLLLGSFNQAIYAPAFCGGFQALGHEVRCIRYEDYLYGNNYFSIFLNRIQTRFHYGPQLYIYNSDISKTANTFGPDIIFLYRCYNIWPSTIKKLTLKGYTIVTYNNDDPFSGIPSNSYYRFFRSILPLADINYVYRPKSIDDYKSVGAKNVKLLLPYYIKSQNYKIDSPKTIPVAFLGHFENDGRDKYIKELVESDVDVTVFNGSDWEKAPLFEDIKHVVKAGKRGAEYNETLNKCQIALVFFSKINSDTYTRRCFEIPATKTLMLSQYSDDMNRLFPEDECAVYFRSEQELAEKCKYLLANPKEINRIAENGYKRVKELGGSEIDRCQQIIDDFKALKQYEER